MKFLSLCSGIEAASVALAGLGMQAIAFAEIEPFPCAVLAHHYAHIPNLGDMTRWREWPEELLLEVEAVFGGTPCQAFSIAGLRGSLDDDRGNLTLIYVEICDHIDALRARHGRPPVVFLWENVPGVLSTGDNAFGCFLGGLAGEDLPLTPPGGRWTDAGYVRGPKRAIAWRSFDAQYFNLAQRRKRVFAFGSARADIRPEEVLFESARLRRDHPPRREPGQDPAGTLTGRSGNSSRQAGANGNLIAADIAPTLDANFGRLQGCSGQDLNHGHSHLIAGTVSAKWAKGSGGPSGDECQNLIAEYPRLCPDCCAPAISAGLAMAGVPCGCTGSLLAAEIAPPLTSNPYGDHESREGLLIGFDCKQGGDTNHGVMDECSPPLRGHDGRNAIAFNLRGREGGAMPEVDPDGLAVQRAADGGSSRSYVAFDTAQVTSPGNRSNPQPGDPSPTLAKTGTASIAYTIHGTDGSASIASESEIACALRTKPPGMIENSSTTVVACQWAVRRLTPRECERLQGFPDDYTRIPGWSGWRKVDAGELLDELRELGLWVKQTKSGTWWVNDPDGPRFKSLGNSWAVPVVRWIGTRIKSQLALTIDTAAA